MARQRRLYIEGFPIHVTMRGVEKRKIFMDDSDRLFYRAALEDAARSYGVAIHSYVFMSNHVHLLVSMETAISIARLFQSLGARYTYYFNRRYERVGTLYQGRHGEVLVKTDSHFFTCMRYVEMNPVEAGMVPSPADHRWSSYGFNALGRPDSLVTPHPLYLDLGNDLVQRCRAYLSMFGTAEDRRQRDEFREAAQGGFAFGDGPFVEWAALKTGRRLPGRLLSGSDPE